MQRGQLGQAGAPGREGDLDDPFGIRIGPRQRSLFALSCQGFGLGLAQDPARPGERQRVLDLSAAQVERQRHHDGADQGQRQLQDRVLPDIGKLDAYHLPPLDTLRQQPARRDSGHARQVRECDRELAVDQGGPVTAGLDVAQRQVRSALGHADILSRSMDLGLSGRSVIVTGGASNIGRAIVLAFAAEGARVLIADLDAERAQQTAVEAGQGAAVKLTDVTSWDSAQAMVADATDRFGGVDVLVNCAGWTVDRLFVEKPREEWEKEIAIDMWGFINCTRAVLDGMIERRRGRIVSISSDAGRIGEWREAVYSGTKAGVIAMSKAIAREVGKHGITLNVVCPGFVPGKPETSGSASVWAGDQGAQFTPEVLEKVARSYPLRRLGTPSDIAPAVLFLASDQASYITGQTLSVDGGYTMI